MEIILINLVGLFVVFWLLQSWRDRRRYRKIMEGDARAMEEMPVEELVDAFYRSDDRIAEIRRYVKLDKEELLASVRTSLEDHPDPAALLEHICEVEKGRKDAQTVIASGELELDEMQKMMFFASFLSAKEHILRFIHERKSGSEAAGESTEE